MPLKFSAITSLGMAAAASLVLSSESQAAPVIANFSSKNVLQGNFEAGGASVFSENDSNARRVGTGGSGGAQRVNQPVLGFTLPTINLGETVDSATFGFTLDSADRVSGEPIGFDMVISLMSQTAITGFSGADFTEDVGSLGSGTLVATLSATDANASISDTFSFSLTGAALTQFAALYDAGGNPTQPVVWFRLSTSASVDTTNASNDNDRFNLATVGAGTGGDIVSTLSFTTVPEPSSFALLGLGVMGLVTRRRR
jgi:hypothetical protein